MTTDQETIWYDGESEEELNAKSGPKPEGYDEMRVGFHYDPEREEFSLTGDRKTAIMVAGALRAASEGGERPPESVRQVLNGMAFRILRVLPREYLVKLRAEMAEAIRDA